MRTSIRVAGPFAALFAGFFSTLRAAPADVTGAEFFESRIRPVFVARCYVCHSSKAPQPQGGLKLDSADAIRKGGNSGPVIQPGDPDKSLLLRALSYKDKDLKMPPGKPLAAETVADFETWIRGGAILPADAKTTPSAKASKLWSLQPPHSPATPAVLNAAWPRNEIDYFVLSKLEEKGLTPSPQADKRTLIRRATYDLTGLPPTAADVDAFVADHSPDAYARLVDRLLASPRYGERWGRYWLDLARYSDARNVGERFAWSYTYRDWVIRAINEDLPYDQFLKLQLAADRPEVNRDPRNLAALGFMSLGREFPKSFPETVDDRIDSVARGMIGLTVACARCHDHKYDPIPTKDYYSFYSIFSNIQEPRDLPLLNAALPKTPLDATYGQRLDRIRRIDADYREKRCAVMVEFFKTQIADYLMAVHDSREMGNTAIEELVRDRQLNLHLLDRWRKYLAKPDPVFQQWRDFASQEHGAAGNPIVAAEFQAHPPHSVREAAERYAAVLLRYDKPEKLSDPDREALRLALRGPDAPVNVPVSEFDLIYTEGDGNNTRGFRGRYEAMLANYAYDGGAPRAMSIEDVPLPKPAHVFIRGNPNNAGAETPAHFLSCLSAGEPRPFTHGSGRLDLALAIADRENPLTARVAVNRIWLHHFGAGIVRTPSDFGFRGDPPTHPELLDMLAVRFMESGWQVKQLHRLIMLSATYQQASADNPEARRQDPENFWLWRMNRQRLDIEALRDSLLAASGELDLTAGGAPFSLAAVPAVSRRTVYGFIERGRIPGFLSAFDFASPDQHVPMRFSTTVPQQALFLLNSEFVAERARHLAHREDVERLQQPDQRVAELYRLALGRAPSAEEIALGVKFVRLGESESSVGTDKTVWRYGFGEFDAASGAVRSFEPFRDFVEDSWQGGSMLPDPVNGNARLRANGGQPGSDLRHAAIRRWVSPVDGKISIEGTLKHTQGAVPAGDGVRAHIVSSRLGELASWIVNGTGAETGLSGIPVQKGDTIDFVVDGRADTENDAFTWAPTVIQSKTKWSAAAEFRGPAEPPLRIWERYAQVLLQTNEFAFVD